MLDSKVGRFFVALKKRRLISVKTLREDSRKLGLVLVGSGLLAIMLKGDWSGTGAGRHRLIVRWFNSAPKNR